MLEPESSSLPQPGSEAISSIPEDDEDETADADADGNGETETGTRLAEVDAPFDFSTPGELEITPDLKSAFKRLLEDKGVELEFRYGGWKGLGEAVRKEKEGYGLVLSAETIYAEGSVGDLIDVLREATVRKGAEDEKDGKSGEEGEGVDVAGKPEEGLDMGKLSVKDDLEWDRVDLQNGGSVVLIAAKVSHCPTFPLTPSSPLPLFP
jgi:protein-histidine N-methyltransferase